MKEGQLKAKIARIISGAIKSTIKDHPKYVNQDGSIRRSATSSIAKRAAGHVLRLLRMHSIGDDSFLSEPTTEFEKGLRKHMHERVLEFQSVALDELPPPLGVELVCVDWGAESDYRTRELAESTKDIRERAERNLAEQLKSQFMGKTRC